MDETKNQDYWLAAWEKNNIKFHRQEIHPFLQSMMPAGAGEVLVPLCGKSHDLLWLCSQGYDVVGVELSEIACQAFFEESKTLFKIEVNGDFRVFRSEETKPSITLWCGDFFALPLEAVQNVTGIYDRAALVALPPKLRIAYVKKLTQLCRTPVYLITVDYDHNLAKGPPFAISPETVDSLFSESFEIEAAGKRADPDLNQNARFLECGEVLERAFRLIPR